MPALVRPRCLQRRIRAAVDYCFLKPLIEILLLPPTVMMQAGADGKPGITSNFGQQLQQRGDSQKREGRWARCSEMDTFHQGKSRTRVAVEHHKAVPEGSPSSVSLYAKI